MFTCILLAAGLSSRFGSPKALVLFKNKPLIEHLQDNLIKSSVDKVIVVLGANADLIQGHVQKHPKIHSIKNENYALGQTSSFQKGLSLISDDTDGILLLPIDYPFIKRQTINALIQQFQKHRPKILIPAYQNHRGHPPIFAASLKTSLERLGPQEGINNIIHRQEADVRIFPCEDKGVILTFNSPQEWENILAQEIPE